MKQVSKTKLELKTHDLIRIGFLVEKLLRDLKGKDYGLYKIAEEDLDVKLALKVIEGMEDFQKENNKGIEIGGAFDNVLEIYNITERQMRFDEAMEKLTYE